MCGLLARFVVFGVVGLLVWLLLVLVLCVWRLSVVAFGLVSVCRLCGLCTAMLL